MRNAAHHLCGGQGTRTDDGNDLSGNELRKSDLEFDAETDVIADGSGIFDTDLQMVIDAWPSLSNEARDEVLEIVKAADRPA